MKEKECVFHFISLVLFSLLLKKNYRNGVPILGTFITEWEKGERENETLLGLLESDEGLSMTITRMIIVLSVSYTLFQLYILLLHFFILQSHTYSLPLFFLSLLFLLLLFLHLSFPIYFCPRHLSLPFLLFPTT